MVRDHAQYPSWRLGPETTLLIVEDDLGTVNALARWLRTMKGMRSEAVYTVADALARIGAVEPLHGLVADVGLPDGSGELVLDEWNARYPGLPALVMTGLAEPAPISSWALLKGASLLLKPFEAPPFLAFADSTVLARWGVPKKIVVPFAAYAGRHALTENQIDLFRKHVNNVPRERIAADLGIAVTTLKTRVRQFCSKVGAMNLAQAYDHMMKAID